MRRLTLNFKQCTLTHFYLSCKLHSNTNHNYNSETMKNAGYVSVSLAGTRTMHTPFLNARPRLLAGMPLSHVQSNAPCMRVKTSSP